MPPSSAAAAASTAKALSSSSVKGRGGGGLARASATIAKAHRAAPSPSAAGGSKLGSTTLQRDRVSGRFYRGGEGGGANHADARGGPLQRQAIMEGMLPPGAGSGFGRTAAPNFGGFGQQQQQQSFGGACASYPSGHAGQRSF